MEGGGPDIFSRTVQANIGFGIVLFGAAMGAIFAVVYCVAIGRVGKISPRNLALLVAGGLFLGFYLVPFLKYPANPPSIGHPETIKDRGGLYLLMVVLSLAFIVGARGMAGPAVGATARQLDDHPAGRRRVHHRDRHCDAAAAVTGSPLGRCPRIRSPGHRDATALDR